MNQLMSLFHLGLDFDNDLSSEGQADLIYSKNFLPFENSVCPFLLPSFPLLKHLFL